jgi:hypothetical protein
MRIVTPATFSFTAKTPRSAMVRHGFYGLNHQDTKNTKVFIV